MPKSVILRGLGVQTLVVTFFSLLIVSYNTLVETKRFSFPLPLLSFPALPFALTSSSLGLLLVFRTNAAYSRWKDARVSWALISARSFDLMRQSILWMPSSSCKSRIVRYTTAFAKVAKWHLGHQGNDKRLRGDLDRILTAGEIDRYIQQLLQWSKKRPYTSLSRLLFLAITKAPFDLMSSFTISVVISYKIRSYVFLTPPIFYYILIFFVDYYIGYLSRGIECNGW